MARTRKTGARTERPYPGRRVRRAAGVMASVGVHLFVLAALLGLKSEPPTTVEAPPVLVSLVRLPKPAPPAPVKARAPPAPAKAVAKPAKRQKAATAPAAPLKLAARKVAAKAPSIAADVAPGPAELTEAQLAGAAGAGSGSRSGGSGSGSGGGSCDMIARVQAALRKDVLVRTEVASAGSRALLVWNGDWVQGRGEDGKGLAAVREAIIWEVGFSPAACRTEPVRGLVMFTLGDGVGAQRLVVGENAWRWADMLGARGVVR